MNWNLNNQILLQGLHYPNFLSYLKIMQDNGTNIIAGISTNYTGDNNYDFPIFELVEQAIAEFGPIETSLILNNPNQVLDAVCEAIASGIKQIIINSREIPPLDLLQIINKAKANNVLILGAGNGGIIIPQKLCLGLIETKFYQPGNIGILSTGDWSLNYEMALLLNHHGLGQSMAINLGNDDILASSIFSWLNMFQNHQETSVIVLMINDKKYISRKESQQVIKELISTIDKPIIAYFLDRQSSLLPISPQNSSKMIAEQTSSFLDNISPQEEIIKHLKDAKVVIADHILEIPALAKKL